MVAFQRPPNTRDHLRSADKEDNLAAAEAKARFTSALRLVHPFVGRPPHVFRASTAEPLARIDNDIAYSSIGLIQSGKDRPDRRSMRVTRTMRRRRFAP